LLGKTKGAASPHEFWYFWRRFFKYDEIQQLSAKQLREIDTDLFLRELAAIESVFNKPLLLKGMIANWNLDFLYEKIPNSIFIHIKRDTLINMHSLYNARNEYYGDAGQWYSFKQPEYSFLKDMSIYRQLAGQVIYGNDAIERQLNTFHSCRTLNVSYDQLCNYPAQVLNIVEKKIENLGVKLNSYMINDLPVRFKSSNELINKNFSANEATDAIKYINETKDK
jgi:hypothetical protein